MTRAIANVLPGQRLIDDGDMLLWRALPSDQRDQLGPFVFIDHYRHQSKRGIGDRPHPHAGIEVLSYLLEGGVEHRDSMGRSDRLGPGDAQHIRAGRGVLHAEQPQGGRHGLQLWAALPPSQKLAEPTYASYREAAIPEIKRDGARVRVLAGRIDDVEGPMHLASPTIWAVARLDAGASIALKVDADAELGLYVLDGLIQHGTEPAIGAGSLAVLTSGDDSVRITATAGQPADVALLGGAPAEGPILFSGPFVMDTAARLEQAKRDYASGKMGTLDGVPF